MKKLLSVSLLLAATLFVQAATDTIRIACVGNSITYGSTIKNSSVDSYPAVLGRLLGSPYQVRNFGFSGRTCLNKGDRPYMKEKMYQEALAFQPNVVVIKLGTNDTKPQNWQFQSEFKQDLTTMVRSFQQLKSQPKVYLCYPATAYSVQWSINDSIIVNGVIPYVNEVAKATGVTVIDLHQATANMAQLFPDNIHPNAEGAKVLAETVAQELLKASKVDSKANEKWLKGKSWAEGMKLEPHACVNVAEFKREYTNNPEAWKLVFRWLKENDPATVAVGKYVLDSANVTVTVTEGPSVRAFEKTKWEGHQKFVDLQYIAKGQEKMGIAPMAGVAKVTPYNVKKDVGFYQPDETKANYVVAKPGTFLLFFPSDAHRPNIQVEGCDTVRKIVFKVRSCWADLALNRTE
jgi:YhcH/YjgK/YiaL family protein